MKSAETKDIDHYDALAALRDRFFGLRCAIKGADIANLAIRTDFDSLQMTSPRP
jgi:hypothetical protein